MSIKTIATTLLVTAFTSSFANAFAIISNDSSYGIIDSVDAHQNTIAIIENATGNKAVLPFTSDSKIVIGSTVSNDLSVLKEGQKVFVKTSSVEKIKHSIEGKILSVNHNEYTVKIRDAKSNKVVNVKFQESTRVSGLDNANSFNGLRRGQTIVARYTTK